MKNLGLYFIIIFVLYSMPAHSKDASLFQRGYQEGCNSGYVADGKEGAYRYKKDYKLYDSNTQYRKGWDAGFNDCKGALKMTDKAIIALQLITMETETDVKELIKYFTLKKHKAFAINPNNKNKFWWTYGRKNKRKVIEYTLKKCGSDCRLFAVDDEIVWENK
jgi:hypothetical protein